MTDFILLDFRSGLDTNMWIGRGLLSSTRTVLSLGHSLELWSR